MKKILTLLIAAGTVVTVHAQSREETRRVILGGPRDNGTYGRNDRDVVLGGNNGRYPAYPNNGQYPNNGNYGNERAYQIDQVNRDYNARIQSIRNDRYLSGAEKDRAIRQLERDRQEQIYRISRQYEANYGRYDDGNNRDERYDRKDNGKHKGWYKGKGNPHGNGNWQDDRGGYRD